MDTVVIYWTIVLTLTLLCHSAQLYEAKRWKSGICEQQLRDVTFQKILIPKPPVPAGHWTSERCEHRPGPEFVLRKYQFRRSNFHMKLFYYSDSECTDPTHVVLAKGAYRVRRGSWRIHGAFEVKYRLFHVAVIAYQADKADYFQAILKRHCPAMKAEKVEPYTKFKILQFSRYNRSAPSYNHKDFDCSKMFNFTLNELQLMRIEKRHLASKWNRKVKVAKTIRKGKGQFDTELFLGDLHTNTKHRQTYRPTAYQSPLKTAKAVHCAVCATISKSDEWFPPRLVSHGHTATPLEGEWVSSRCETRSYGQFLTRHLLFLPGGKSWQGEYTFYKDPVCSEPSFSLFAKGDYVKGKDSGIVPFAVEYVFRTMKLKLTLKQPSLVDYFNSYGGNKCGVPRAWKLGVTQDVTSTKGCEILGLKLPNVEYEILKTEMRNDADYLYVGQRPSEQVSLAVPENRPTSFQLPLTRCSANEINAAPVAPSFSAYSSAMQVQLMPKNAGTSTTTVNWTLVRTVSVCLLAVLVML